MYLVLILHGIVLKLVNVLYNLEDNVYECSALYTIHGTLCIHTFYSTNLTPPTPECLAKTRLTIKSS